MHVKRNKELTSSGSTGILFECNMIVFDVREDCFKALITGLTKGYIKNTQFFPLVVVLSEGIKYLSVRGGEFKMPCVI